MENESLPTSIEKPGSNEAHGLRLTPIEVCWLLEDCEAHPMQFFLRLRVAGRFDRDKFPEAVQATFERHPLLNARVEQTGKSRWEWRDASSLPFNVDWRRRDGDALPSDFPRIDIRHERGLRVTVIESSNITNVVLQFHHVVCDGLSAADVAGDILTAYANVTSDKTFKHKKLDPNRMAIRSSDGLSRKEKSRWLLGSFFALNRFRRFYKRRPMMLVRRPQPKEHETRERYPETHFCRLSRQESLELQQRAQSFTTTVNSLLLANMFTSISRWRYDYKPTDGKDLFRITMPVSLRTAAHRSIPASNSVSLVCFDREIGKCDDETEMIAWVDQKMERVKTERRGLILPFALKMLQRWPNQLAKGIRRKQFSGTALISNLGPVLTNCHLPRVEGKITIGDLVVENIEFVPVLRPAQCVTFAASTYAGRITLGMHFDSRAIDRKDAATLFRRFVAAIGAAPSHDSDSAKSKTAA